MLMTKSIRLLTGTPLIQWYCHLFRLYLIGLNEKYLEIKDCQFGKYAGLALLQGLAPGIEIKEHGTQLCKCITVSYL